MGKYTGPKNRLSRREGVDLFGRGNKLRRSSQIPGQHGPKGSRSRRVSDYGQQLREKQKTKRFYGIMERQFRKYFETSTLSRGQTGERLLQILESRLDNVVYRLGLAPTRAMARQLASHGHVTIDGRTVNIPSCQVRAGQSVTLSQTALSIPAVSAKVENSDIHLPDWLERKGPVGRVLRLPARAEIDCPVNEQLIVEFYSR